MISKTRFMGRSAPKPALKSSSLFSGLLAEGAEGLKLTSSLASGLGMPNALLLAGWHRDRCGTLTWRAVAVMALHLSQATSQHSPQFLHSKRRNFSVSALAIICLSLEKSNLKSNLVVGGHELMRGCRSDSFNAFFFSTPYPLPHQETHFR